MLTPCLPESSQMFGVVTRGIQQTEQLLRHLLGRCPGVTVSRPSDTGPITVAIPHRLAQSPLLYALMTVAAAGGSRRSAAEMLQRALEIPHVMERIACEMIHKTPKEHLHVGEDSLTIQCSSWEQEWRLLLLSELYQCLRPAEAPELGWVEVWIGYSMLAGYQLPVIDRAQLSRLDRLYDWCTGMAQDLPLKGADSCVVGGTFHDADDAQRALMSLIAASGPHHYDRAGGRVLLSEPDTIRRRLAARYPKPDPDDVPTWIHQLIHAHMADLLQSSGDLAVIELDTVRRLVEAEAPRYHGPHRAWLPAEFLTQLYTAIALDRAFTVCLSLFPEGRLTIGWGGLTLADIPEFPAFIDLWRNTTGQEQMAVLPYPLW